MQIDHPNIFKRKMYFNNPLIDIIGTFLYYLKKESPIVKSNSHKSIKELLTDGFNYMNRIVKFYPAKYNAIAIKEEFENHLRILDNRIEDFLDMRIGEVYPLIDEKLVKSSDIFVRVLEDVLVKFVGKSFGVDLTKIVFKHKTKITYREYFESLLEKKEFEPLRESMIEYNQSINGSYIFYDYLIAVTVRCQRFKNNKFYLNFLWFYMLNTMLIYHVTIGESLFEIYFKTLMFEKLLYETIEKDYDISFDVSLVKTFFRPVLSSFKMRFQKYRMFIEKTTNELKGEFL